MEEKAQKPSSLQCIKTDNFPKFNYKKRAGISLPALLALYAETEYLDM